MLDLKKLLFKSLAKQKIAQVSRWAMINKILENYVKDSFSISQQFSWKIENNIYVIKSPNSALSSMLFLHKKNILDYINKKLLEMNLEVVKDIKIL